ARGKPKALAGPAHPADAARRHADNQSIVGHVARNGGAGADESVRPDGDAADQGRVGADRRTALDQGFAVLVLARNVAARIDHVGEHHARAAEDIVLERDAIVDRHIVLDTHAVADDYPVADEAVLPEGAAAADSCAGADV